MIRRWLLAALSFISLVVNAAPAGSQSVPWYEARRDPSGQAPDPATTREAVIQVYAARAVAWRGYFAVHTWIVIKPTAGVRFERFEVIGFGVQQGAPAIRVDRMGPDNYWFGAKPDLILDRRGAGVDAMIEKVRAAVGSYPWPDEYRPWPGPNSNTFIAWIAREVPELRLNLPSTAVGKDYLGAMPVARAPSGTGVQLSVLGVAGGIVALDEGLELNLLGLVFGLDLKAPAIKLPLIGRVGWSPGFQSAPN